MDEVFLFFINHVSLLLCHFLLRRLLNQQVGNVLELLALDRILLRLIVFIVLIILRVTIVRKTKLIVHHQLRVGDVGQRTNFLGILHDLRLKQPLLLSQQGLRSLSVKLS